MEFFRSFDKSLDSIKWSPNLLSGGHLMLSKLWLQLKKNLTRSIQVRQVDSQKP